MENNEIYFPLGKKIPINHIFHTSCDCLKQPNPATRLPVTPSAASRRLHQALGKEASGRKWQLGHRLTVCAQAVLQCCLEFKERVSQYFRVIVSFSLKKNESELWASVSLKVGAHSEYKSTALCFPEVTTVEEFPPFWISAHTPLSQSMQTCNIMPTGNLITGSLSHPQNSESLLELNSQVSLWNVGCCWKLLRTCVSVP